MYQVILLDIWGSEFTPHYNFETLAKAKKFTKSILGGSDIRKKDLGYDSDLQSYMIMYSIRKGSGPNGLKKATIIWEEKNEKQN